MGKASHLRRTLKEEGTGVSSQQGVAAQGSGETTRGKEEEGVMQATDQH
jgi:hypothetical protein